MGYKYEEHRERILSDEGMDMYIQMINKAKELKQVAGAFQMQNLISGFAGDSWLMLACVDMLVEKGVIREVPQDPNRIVTQEKIYK